ncbi:MAG: hypothetical protein SCALA702_25390 [Melioribacteraceae bacterium]|nr:MAG: hypothetical protein SCALA702_25390 [Melioribacteraceae bacterium]
MNIIKSGKAVVSLVLLVFLASCGIWQDFTTYFNTYYNAKTIFDETEELIEDQRVNRFEFKQVKLPGNIESNLTSVIEKCSRILQFDAESSYFDDALFIIGKSFYMQGDFSKAKRKFGELVIVEESDLVLKAKMWLAFCDLQLRSFDEGLNLLNTVREEAITAGNQEIIEETYIKEIAFLIYRENFILAVEECKQLIDATPSDGLKAEVYYQLGILYTELEDEKNASDAFAKVSEFSPEYEIEFNSRFENAKLLRSLDRKDEALAVLEELRDEDKNSDNFDKIDYEIGMIFYEQDKLDDALDKFRDVDTTYKNTDAAGKSSFIMGQIWENYYHNYDSAKYFYDRSLTTQMEPELKEEAKKKKELFNKYDSFNRDIKRYEQQLLYVEQPEIYVADSLAYEDYLNRDTTEFAVEEYDDEGNLIVEEVPQKPFKPSLSPDSLHTILAKNKFDLGNLFLTELNQPDSAYIQYKEIERVHDEGDSPAKLRFAMGTYYETIGNQPKADSLYNEVYTNYRFDAVANEAARKLGKELIAEEKDPSEILYLHAEDLIEGEEYNPAIDSLYKIYNEHPSSHLAARSLYTIGYLLENNIGDKDSAASVYDTLYTKYRQTDYGRAVTSKLNFYKSEQKRIADSIKAVEKQIADSLAAIEAEQLRIADSIAAANKPIVDSLSIGETGQVDSLLGLSTANDSTVVGTDVIKDSTDTSENTETDTLKNLDPRDPRVKRPRPQNIP